MQDILSRLKNGPVIVADGATGTMLQAAGMPAGTAPEGWLLEDPAPTREVHRAYIEAGSDMILTCTFGATRARLERAGLTDRVAEINRLAVAIAREAAGDSVYVAGDIGPLGKLLAPLGTTTYAEAVDIFSEQAAALAEAGVDVLYIETMSDLDEIRAAIQAAHQSGLGIPVFATMSFDRHGRTNMGVRPEEAAETLHGLKVDAFGANCGATLEMTEGAVAKLHETVPTAPLIVKPNAGKPHMEGREVIYDATPEDMAKYARRFVALGARVIGGCCGSSPAHIAAIAKALR